MKFRIIYLVFSLCFLVPGMYFLVTSGLKPGLDFTGGTAVEVKLEKPATLEQLHGVLSQDPFNAASIQETATNTFLIKTKDLTQEQNKQLIAAVGKNYGAVTLLRNETIGPVLGQELLQKTAIAVLFAVVGILFYIAWSFKNIRYGVSAIIALIHDVLIVIGMFAILGKFRGIEVDSHLVTAVLTTMSFSVHDTIVVFHRIRELHQKSGGMSFEHLIDTALTETMGRSLNNSLTIIFMLLALFLMGGETVKWFVFALLIGTISGTYSSPFVATPILYQWHILRDKRSK